MAQTETRCTGDVDTAVLWERIELIAKDLNKLEEPAAVLEDLRKVAAVEGMPSTHRALTALRDAWGEA